MDFTLSSETHNVEMKPAALETIDEDEDLVTTSTTLQGRNSSASTAIRKPTKRGTRRRPKVVRTENSELTNQ